MYGLFRLTPQAPAAAAMRAVWAAPRRRHAVLVTGNANPGIRRAAPSLGLIGLVALWAQVAR